MRLHASFMFAATVVVTLGAAARAEILTVTIENLQSPGGFSFTPVWFGFHDGSFDSFSPGSSASLFDGIEQVAELGDTSGISSRFSTNQPQGVQGTVAELNGAPVFSPGEMRMTSFDVNPNSNSHLSFLSMLVPSNDLFLGNSVALELFNNGNFNGPVTIEIYGSMVWDAGTETNSVLDGGAFVSGVDATLGGAEGGVIRAFFTERGDSAYLDSIVGVTTADGGSISRSFGSETLIGRITIVPAPGAGLALVIGGALMRGRRRN